MGKLYEEFQVGDKESFTKTVTETDVVMYAGITGDFNPAHMNKVSASESMFKQRIAHGMLTAGFISTVVGMKLPGEGAIYVSQELKFVSPVFINDTITAEAEIVEKLEKGRIKLKTTCTKEDGTVVVEGFAVMMIPRPKK